MCVEVSNSVVYSQAFHVLTSHSLDIEMNYSRSSSRQTTAQYKSTFEYYSFALAMYKYSKQLLMRRTFDNKTDMVCLNEFLQYLLADRIYGTHYQLIQYIRVTPNVW